MAATNTTGDILRDALESLEEAKKLIANNCKVSATSKIDYAITVIKVKLGIIK